MSNSVISSSASSTTASSPSKRASITEKVKSLFTSSSKNPSPIDSPVKTEVSDVINAGPEGPKVCIVGAGLAGCMSAALISKLTDAYGMNFNVHLYEKREDPRFENQSQESFSNAFGASTSATKRSINLALSYRGQLALQEIGLLDEVMETAVEMPGRVIHNLDGSVVKQAYGKPGEALQSIGRQTLNMTILHHLSNKQNVKLNFGQTLKNVDNDGNVEFESVDGKVIKRSFDLIIGADGAYSVTRETLLKSNRISFSRDYIAHGYKELNIPARRNETTGEPEYAIEHFNGLHIWPRGDFMLIALPNPDCSFTATLFAPYKGKDGFDQVDPNNIGQVTEYFQKYFPDVVHIMPEITKDFRENPVGSLVTIRVNPWVSKKVVLIGDAAHAVVPFFGQGMNAAFEDGYLLYHELKRKCQTMHYNLEDIISEFADKRRPAANALADLCIEHYNDMASNTSSMTYLIGKKIEGVLSTILPSSFIPLYSMVSFSNVPYHEAVARAQRQDDIIWSLMWGGVVIAGGLMSANWFFHSRRTIFGRN